MKNLALIFIALMGTTFVSSAQEGIRKVEPRKTESKRGTSVKTKVVKKEERKKEEKIQKVN